MLRRRLTFPAAAIALALSLLLTGLGFATGRVIVSIMSNQLIRQMAQAVRRDVDVIVTNAERTLTRAVNSIGRHGVPLSDPAALRRELYGLLSDEPYVDWLFCGNEAGGAVDAGRLPDGTLVYLMTDNFRAGVMREYEASPDGRLGTLRKSGVEFDTRQKLWYTRAKDTHARYWTEPFLGSAEPILGMALSVPVFDKDGGFAGVCGLDLILTSLSRLMESLHLGDTGRAFIIDGTGHLIASSGGVVPVVTGADGKEARLVASEAGDPVVRGTSRHLGRHPEIVGPSSTGLQVFSFDDPTQGKIYAAVDRLEAPGGIAWTIVAALPASDFLGPVKREAYSSIAIGAFVVVVSLILGLWAVRRTLQPMTALTEAAQAIAKGEWRSVPEVRRNDEIGLLAQAFTLMTARLKDTLDGLRRSEESYRTIFENALEGIARTSLDGRILTANPTLARIFGYASANEMVTDERKLLYVSEHERDAVMAAVSTTGAVVGYEAEFYRRDGQRIWVTFSSRMVRDASGTELFVESFMTDITERKGAEDALHQAQGELAHATRVATLGELTASIVHEINQPLSAVANNASACLRWLTAENLEEVRQSAARVVADAHRAGEIVGRVRALAKKAPLRKDWLDINEAIGEVCVLVQSEIQGHRVALQTRLAGGLPPMWGDRIQLQQVMLNLLVNAIEAMSRVSERPRELWVSTEKGDAADVVITVRDSGPGLDPQSLDRLFDAFYTTKADGLGMGLAISRSVVRSHGGRLWATANVPHGAVFQFTLPMGREGAA